jgi:hypothetical protein
MLPIPKNRGGLNARKSFRQDLNFLTNDCSGTAFVATSDVHPGFRPRRAFVYQGGPGIADLYISAPNAATQTINVESQLSFGPVCTDIPTALTPDQIAYTPSTDLMTFVPPFHLQP